MKYVKQISVDTQLTVGQMVDEMGKCGVLGAGRLARAVDIMVEMFERPEYTTFLTLAGPMVPGGLRGIISLLIERGYIDAVVTSGANIVHDVMEALGYGGTREEAIIGDSTLRLRKIGRVEDIHFRQKGFEAFEKKTYEVFDSIIAEKKESIAIHELLSLIGEALEDENSFLKKASFRKVPVFSPAVMDSMLGIHIWTYCQLKRIHIDPVLDLNKMADIMFTSKKIGAIILGGGVPKHHVLGASILREGVDAAVQVTLDRPEGGSLSGAPLEEAISWKKAQVKSKLANVIGDATIVFPIMAASALEKLEVKEKQN